MNVQRDFWQGRRVLVTGHTGFKGAWLCLWLQSLGAVVSGLSRGVPTSPSLYRLAHVGAHMSEHAADVRDAHAVREVLAEVRPEVVLHLAAQPIVRRSLREPASTYEVNVMGTVNVLEAVRELAGAVCAVVIVTSDKCYENDARPRRFLESHPLGGADPYSSSKACAELVTAAYRSSFFAGDGLEADTLLASARAGNVIGGGDWGEDRLLADALRAIERRQPLLVRNPHAVRPWQHVLSPLGGYLRLAQRLAQGERAAARAWNFGPHAEDERTVGWVVERLVELWEGELAWHADERSNPREAPRLALDSSASEHELDWRPACDLGEALELIVAWHRAQRAGEDMRSVSVGQIEALGALRRSSA